MNQKVKVRVLKLNEKAQVEVKDNRVAVYSQISKMLPMFNNIGNEIVISDRIESVITQIPTGISIEQTDKKFISKFILKKELENLGIKCYNQELEKGELKIKLQNLGNIKVAIKEKELVGYIVFIPITEIECSIEEVEQ